MSTHKDLWEIKKTPFLGNFQLYKNGEIVVLNNHSIVCKELLNILNIMDKNHKFFNNEPAYHAAKEAEKWMMEAERLKSELLHRDINVIPEKDAEYERLKKSMELDIKVRESRIDEQNVTIKNQFDIIRDLYNSSKRYEDKYQGLFQWELPSFLKAKQMLIECGYPEHNQEK